ncbi:hypothetical protein GOP47_0027020 [Adiantum capillus-veneris]|nr:hypothetical protein GOP47_0027020 [Adiantum capillus-veneris]
MLKLLFYVKKHVDVSHAEYLTRRTLQTCDFAGSRLVCFNVLHALRNCIAQKSVDHGRQIHDEILQSGLLFDVVVSNTLLNMYIRCGSFEDAYKLFECLHERDIASWNLIIEGYNKCGRHKEAIAHFWDMNRAGVKPSKITFLSVLKACTEVESLEDGKAVHAAVRDEMNSDVFVESAIIGMYAKCGCIQKGRQLFDEMQERDVVSWNVMIGVYGQIGKVKEVSSLFQQMQKEGIPPDNVTFGNLLKACTNAASLDLGQEMHSYMVKCGVYSSLMFGSSLVDMYAKCGSIRDARVVFDKLSSRDVVIYNVMISGYAEARLGDEAFKLLFQMEDEHMKPDRVTFLCLLKACIGLSSVELGKQVHVHAIVHGYGLDMKVMNTMIDMYAKCGGIAQARQVFDGLPKDDVVTWTAMISCYVHHRQFDEAFKLFWQMQAEKLQLNEAAYVIVLKACAQTGALEQGREIHELIRETGFQTTILVESALIDMYCKCGSVDLAHRTFNHMPKHDIVSWTSMLTGYAQHGHGLEALQIAKKMLAEGYKLGRITTLAVLSALNYMGQFDYALSFFCSMTRDHGIVPSGEHYACMVDLLGRAGHLDKVDLLLQNMPCQPDAKVWTASLGACGVHGNMELAKLISESLCTVEPQSTAAFVLLSNMCARSTMEESLATIVDFEEIEVDSNYVNCT